MSAHTTAQPEPDYGIDEIALAKRILLFMGHARTSSCEPGADYRTDKIAAMIGEFVAAQASVAPADSKDAIRYRWLRDKSEPASAHFICLSARRSWA